MARHLANWEKDAIAYASSRFLFAVDANAALSSRVGEIHPINAYLAREIFELVYPEVFESYVVTPLQLVVHDARNENATR